MSKCWLVGIVLLACCFTLPVLGSPNCEPGSGVGSQACEPTGPRFRKISLLF